MHPAKPIIHRIAVFILLLTTIFSCIKEEFDPDKLNNSVQINPSVGSPIGYLNFNLESMLTDTTRPDILEINQDGKITLRYKQRIFTDTLEDMINVTDVNVNLPKSNDNGRIDLSILGALDEMVIPYTKRVALDTSNNENIRIDSIWVRNLSIEVSLNASDDLNADLQLLSQSFISEQDNDSLDMNIPFDGTVTTQVLNNYTIFPVDNHLILNFKFTMRNSPLVFEPGDDFFGLNFRIVNAEIEAIFGDFGNIDMDLPPQTMNISFYNSILEGAFRFQDPQLNIYFSNSIGVPVQVSLPDFYVIDRFSDTTDIINTTGNSIPTVRNPKIIDFPTTITRHDIAGRTVYDSLILDLNETNVFYILEHVRPTTLTFNVAGEVNPPSSQETFNFIASDSYFSVDLELVLPLVGNASMTLKDTLEFDFTNIYSKPPEEIESLTFLVNFENGFPVEVEAQLFFYGESYNDSIGPLFERGYYPVDAGVPDGRLGCGVSPSRQTQLVPFTLDRIEELSRSKIAIAWAVVNTYDYHKSRPDVAFCQDHYFKTNIGIIVKANVNSADYVDDN